MPSLDLRTQPRKVLLAAGYALLLGLPAQAAPPVLLFSDMTDGPVSSWEGSPTKGAAVSIWGTNFPAARGTSTVTVCGVTLNSAADFAEWAVTVNENSGDPADDFIQARGLQRTAFWLKSSMTLGPGTISVTTPDGTSATLPFYCRNTGRILFVAPPSSGGSDSNNGTRATNQGGGNGPFATPASIRPTNKAVAGDVYYFRAGSYDYNDGNNCMFNLEDANHNNGSPNNSITLTAYPGEIPRMGTPGPNLDCFVDHHNSSGNGNDWEHWTYSKLKIRTPGGSFECPGGSGSSTLQHSTKGIRIIGNDVSGTRNGNVTALTIAFRASTEDVYIYGNHIHDQGVSNRGDLAVDQSNAIYIAGNGHAELIDIGWNEFGHNTCARGLQVFGHTDGDTIETLLVHDNYAHHNTEGSACTQGNAGGGHGMALGGRDGGGSTTFVLNGHVWNNICAYNDLDGFVFGNGTPQGGNWYVYNNISYKNNNDEFVTKLENPDVFEFRNNIVYAQDGSGASYWVFANGATEGDITAASHNLYFNGGGPPGWDATGVLNVDPKLVSANPVAAADFQPQPSSPVVNSGMALPTVLKDFLGLPRGTPPERGAFETAAPSGAPSVTISSPTSQSTYATPAATVSLAGSASDNVAVTGVSWTSSTGAGGAAIGTTSWTISDIPLQVGPNVITVTAGDAQLNTGSDILTVTRDVEPPPPGQPSVE